ncbi:uncharacterized protein LOC119640222 [Glossina fuscipes]|uniref:Uncharacterized protein LOC119640222 n=1 Tax=Glossina fuscipes TaxID=7396 RepID=A0A9C5ZCM5_9MUSC|nr:uncharacterized protein LOC119640222 [Glossina fuscipes]XP_037894024.1 uncharacterized protein LOC119640222 [Glossina fuscipes]
MTLDTTFANMSQPRILSTFRVSTKYFTPEDLELYVESNEILQRLERKKQERKEIKRAAKAIYNNSIRHYNTLAHINGLAESSFALSINESIDEPLLIMENRKVPSTPDKAEFDESYFSWPSSRQSTPRHMPKCDFSKQHPKLCTPLSQSFVNLTLNSSESGVFANDNARCKTLPMRQKGEPIKKSPSVALSSPLKRWLPRTKNSVKLLSCRVIDEYENLKIYEEEKQRNNNSNVFNEPAKKINLKKFATLIRTKSKKNCVYAIQKKSVVDNSFNYLSL